MQILTRVLDSESSDEVVSGCCRFCSRGFDEGGIRQGDLKSDAGGLVVIAWRYQLNEADGETRTYGVATM